MIYLWYWKSKDASLISWTYVHIRGNNYGKGVHNTIWNYYIKECSRERNWQKLTYPGKVKKLLKSLWYRLLNKVILFPDLLWQSAYACCPRVITKSSFLRNQKYPGVPHIYWVMSSLKDKTKNLGWIQVTKTQVHFSEQVSLVSYRFGDPEVQQEVIF